MKNKIVNDMTLSNELYASMSFAYRLDKEIEFSYVNYSFISDALIDILNSKNIKINFEYKNLNNLKKNNNYFSTYKDETVTIYNKENSIIENVSITKKGNSHSVYNSGVIGNNSALLSIENIVLKNGTIKTFGVGAKGFYQKNKNKKSTMENFIIETMQKNSNAVEVCEGSNIKLYNVYIYTNDNCSGGLCVSANSEINANKTTVYTTGELSPGLYLNGVFTLNKSLIETSYSYVAVLEGNSKLISIESSLRGYKGIKVLNNISSKEIKSNIGIIGRYLNVEKGWAFNCENSNVDINLLNTNIVSKDKKLIILKNNNGDKNFSHLVLKNSSVCGEINSDGKNILNISVNDRSYISGITKGNVNIKFCGKIYSYFSMTGDSYFKKIELMGNNIEELIKHFYLNGFTLYYDPIENLWLNGKVYYFEDGSIVKPTER